MFNDIIQFFNLLTGDMHLFGYVLVLLVAFLETTLGVGLFLPGSTIILIAGSFSAKGYFNVFFLFLVSVLGAVFGDNLNYFLGKKYGKKWIQNSVWFLREKHFKKAERLFQKYGNKSVFLGRFVPSVKEIVPFIAGTLRMKKNKFVFWNVLGALGWSLELLSVGYFFGHSLRLTQHILHIVGAVFICVFLLFLVFQGLRIFWQQYQHKKAKKF